MSDKYEPKHRMDENLFKVRHSMAHILAQAVLQVRPKAQLGFGPPIRTGFYYDFLLEEPLTEADLPDIEKRMRKIIQEKETFEREDLPKEQALEKLAKMGQSLKVEYAQELLGAGENLSFYTSGPFVDMCEGPHVENTSQIPVMSFKLDSIAGSYWRGDSAKPMLTRIYGLCYSLRVRTKGVREKQRIGTEKGPSETGSGTGTFHD